MALTNNANYDRTLIFLSPRSRVKDKDGKEQELDRPYFEIAKFNDEGKIEKTQDTCSKVTGRLSGINVTSREYQGQVNKHAIILISDDTAKETYHIDFSFRIASRSLFNSMLSLASGDDLALSYYRSKKGFEAFALEQSGEKVSWKYKLEELPQSEQIKDKKGNLVKTDYSEVDEFYEKELKALAVRLFGDKKSGKAAPAKTEEPTPAPVPAPAPTEDANNEDVPF